MSKKDKCTDEKCLKCPLNGGCPIQGTPLAHLPPELESFLQKVIKRSSSPQEIVNHQFSSVDAIVAKVLEEFDAEHGIWNSLTGWQIDPPNDSVGGFAWRLRSLVFLNGVEFSNGKSEKMVREAFEIIAKIMMLAIHEKCDGSVCKTCILTSRCPLESQVQRK